MNVGRRRAVNNVMGGLTALAALLVVLPLLLIFAYAISPYEDWHRQAWAGALVLIVLIFVASLVTRLATKGRYGGAR